MFHVLSTSIEMGFQKAQDQGSPTSRPLADFGPREGGVVRAVEGSGPMFVRLLEMGFVPGVRVEVIKRAPLGDPIELRVHGYHVSLRRAEARHIQVSPQSAWDAATHGYAALEAAEAAE